MKTKSFFIAALLLSVAFGLSSCTNEDEQKENKESLSKEEKKAMTDFSAKFASLSKTIKPIFQKAQSRANVNGSMMQNFTPEEKAKLDTFAVELDKSSVNLFLELGFTEEEIEYYKLLEQPLYASSLALNCMSALGDIEVLQPIGKTDIFGPIGGSGFEIAQHLNNAIECLNEVLGVDMKSLVYATIAGTMTKASIKKAIIEVIKKSAGKIAKAATGYGTAILVAQWGSCMFFKYF